MLNRRSYVVEREAPGAHASSGPLAGQWVPGAVSVTAVSGSLQPVTDRDAMLLPEGVRERAKSKLYTDPTAVLQTWGIDSQTRGDIVVDEDGERLQVWGTRGYHRAQLDHRRYMLVREPDAR